MRKMLMLIVCIHLLAASHFAESAHPLPGVLQPQTIHVFGGELFVVEGATVWVFALDPFKGEMKFGREGEGPGELKVTNTWTNTVDVSSDQILIDGLDKVVCFSRDGSLSSELKKPFGIYQTRRVGKNFVGVKQIQIEDKTQYQSVVVFDSAFRPIKEIARQESPIQSVAATTEMIPDILNFRVWRDRIYVERSREGFRIDVFNSHGEEVSQISREVPPLRVTESDRRAALELLKGDPFVKQIGWEEFKRFSKLIFPDMFPPIQNIVVDQDRILVQTFKTRGSDESWMVLDLEGHFIREVYLPRVERTSFMAHLMGVTRFAIHGGFFYHLNEEEETETWEIRVLPI